MRRIIAYSIAWLGSAVAAAQPPVPAIFGHYAPPAHYAEQVTHTFYLPMRDGTKLAMRVTQPAVGGKPAPGRFPVVWHHTLSVTQEAIDGTGPRAGGFRAMPTLTQYGYVVVQVARRGNGQSFGTMRGYHDRNETQDAYEITEWLAAQPWSTGDVGLYGCSNTGDAAIQALTVRPPHLKAVFSGCFSWHKYDAMRRGGIFAQWGTGPTRTIAQDVAIPAVDGDESKILLAQAATEHQLAVPLFELWQSLPYRDSFSRQVQSRFWAEGSAQNYADAMRRSGAAVYIVGGWHDEFRDQGLIAQANLPGSRIVIGPWLHCYNDGFALVEEAHRFYDAALKGIDTGLAAQAPIHYFTINAPAGHEWHASSVWPLADTRMTPLYLASGGSLRDRMAAGPGTAFTVRYDVPCPTAESISLFQPCHAPGAGASFTGQVLRVPIELTGSAVADMWISTTAPDANIFLYVEDVAPDGKVTVVTEGRLRASLRKTATPPFAIPGDYPWHRDYAEDAAPLTPGEPARLRFDILPTSYIVPAGHRVQVTVAGADFRERGRVEGRPPPVIRILADAAHPSLVTLPIIPAARL